jgi:hypothetical protein
MTDDRQMAIRTFPTAFKLKAIKRAEGGEGVLPVARKLESFVHSHRSGSFLLGRPRPDCTARNRFDECRKRSILYHLSRPNFEQEVSAHLSRLPEVMVLSTLAQQFVERR